MKLIVHTWLPYGLALFSALPGLVSPGLAFGEVPTQVCVTSVSSKQISYSYRIEIFGDQEPPMAKITHVQPGNQASNQAGNQANGKSMNVSDQVEVNEYDVQAGLHPGEFDDFDLNFGELLIVHAMSLTRARSTHGIFSAGLDLSAVRWVRVSMIGQMSDQGGFAVIEARDRNGQDLGSFLGGYVVSPCKK